MANKSTGTLAYPVGKNMQAAMIFAKSAADQFLNIKEFDNINRFNIVCRGSSGAILAALFIGNMPYPEKFLLYHVKKESETSHNDDVEMDISYPIVIIDDFIDSGHTVKAIYRKIKESLGLNTDILISCLIVEQLKERELDKIPFIPRYGIAFDINE